MTAPNPLIAERQDSTRIWSGITLVEGIVDVKHGIESGSWVSTNIGSAFVAIDGALLAMDPLGSLLSWGVAWCIEHVKPLTDALDWLAGDPDQVAANAQTWANIAANTRLAVEDLRESVQRDVAVWAGPAADAYRASAETESVALLGYAESAAAKSSAVELSGNVVLVVRTFVRDLIADLVSILVMRIPQWTAEMGLTLGIATPWVVAQVSALAAKWSLKISTLLYDLIDSLRRLFNLVRQVDEFTAALNARPRGTHHYYPGDEDNLHHQEPQGPPGPRLSMDLAQVHGIAARYGVDLQGLKIVLRKDRVGYEGSTGPDGSISLTRDAFRNEEQLARTLAHEHYHVEQIRNGLPYPQTKAEAVSWEREAYAYEQRWWDSHPLNPAHRSKP